MHPRISKPTLRDRINEVVNAEHTSPDLTRDYLNKLVDRHSELGTGQRTAAFASVALAGVFIVLSGTSVSEVTVLGVKLTDFALLRALIPPVVVGLVVRSVSLANEKGMVRDVYSGLIKVYWPELHATKLHHLLLPSGLLLSTGRNPITAGTRYDRIQAASQRAESFLLVFVIPAGFTSYAFYRLFDAYGPRNALVWLSLLTTGTMFALLLLARRGPEIYPPGYAPDDGPTEPAAGYLESS
jgi:hypothetical protein